MSIDQRIYRQSANGAEEESESSLQEARSNVSRSRREEKGRLKVALVHDWLNGMRGGEIVFEAMLDLYPDADVYTLIYEPRKLSPSLQKKLSRVKVHSSWLNILLFTRKNYRHLLPILPFVIRQFDLYPYDLILSSSHCVAKGVKKHPGATHVSYVHAPMRYMWDRFDDYFGKGRINPLFRLFALLVRPFLQWWDKRTSQADRIDVLISNSDFIGEQIERCYGRKAVTVYPFAKLERFQGERKTGNFYLMVGAFAPYKRTDLAIEAFARLGLPLRIVGQGQDEERIRELRDRLHARNIEFIKRPSNEMIERLYLECKAFIFPGKEDFGITPLEAMASGAPVIAFNEGGACETVNKKTGILFQPQTTDALAEAVMEIESGRRYFEPISCRNRANFFTEERFKKELSQIIADALARKIL